MSRTQSRRCRPPASSGRPATSSPSTAANSTFDPRRATRLQSCPPSLPGGFMRVMSRLVLLTFLALSACDPGKALPPAPTTPHPIPGGGSGTTNVQPAAGGFQERLNDRVAYAKKLMTDAGYPDGKGFPKLELLYNTDEGHKKIAAAIQQMWRKNLGIDVELRNS